MNTLIHADIFFFVATIGLILFIILGIVAMAQVVGILRSVRVISKKLEGNIEHISDDAKAFVHDLRESMLYRWIFRKRRSR